MSNEKKKKCKHCNGTGYISRIEDFAAEEWVKGENERVPLETEECEACNGTGYIEKEN